MALLEQIGLERIGSAPVLKTKRLTLRPADAADAQAIAALANDHRVAENTLRIPHPYGLADARAFIRAATAADGETVFLIALADGELIGACGIATLAAGQPEIGYWLGVRFWGQGYATEAAAAVVEHAFLNAGHEFLLAGARITNYTSRRVLEKCGFEWTGVCLSRIHALGFSVPVDRFRLSRHDWIRTTHGTLAI